MIKDREYYLNLELECVPQHVKDSPEIRATHGLWGDVINAIWWRTQSSPVSAAKLRRALGEPDDVAAINSTDEAWVYNWLGKHGPNTYSSASAFHIRDGAVVGIIGRHGDD